MPEITFTFLPVCRAALSRPTLFCLDRARRQFCRLQIWLKSVLLFFPFRNPQNTCASPTLWRPELCIVEKCRCLILFCVLLFPLSIRRTLNSEHVRLAHYSLADSDVRTSTTYSRFVFGLLLISFAETFDSGHVRLADQIQKVSDVRTPIIR